MKSGLILIATIFGLLIVASIKHLPFIQFFGTSSILIVCIALMAVTIKFGPKPVLAAFAGKDASTAKVIIQSIWIAAGLGTIQSIFVVLNNLLNPDAIGPATMVSLLAIFYALLIHLWLFVSNSNHEKSAVTVKEK